MQRERNSPPKEKRRKGAKEMTPEEAAWWRQKDILDRARDTFARTDWKRAAVCMKCGDIIEAEGKPDPCPNRCGAPQIFISV